MGRSEEAVEAYRDALKADPRYAQAVENLSSLLEREGRLTEAMEELRRLLSMEPGNVDARLRLAGSCRSLENFPEAIQHYSGHPEDPAAQTPTRSRVSPWRTPARERRRRRSACYARLEAVGRRGRGVPAGSRDAPEGDR